MAVDQHIRRGHPIVFGLIILFALIELALAAWLTARFDAKHDYRNLTERDRVRYVLFSSTWTAIFSIFYLTIFLHSATGSILTSVASHVLFLFLTWIMWTAGAAAVTQMLGGGLNCNTQHTYVYCGQLNALEGFAWIIWILVTLALIVALFRGVSAARRGDGYSGALI